MTTMKSVLPQSFKSSLSERDGGGGGEMNSYVNPLVEGYGLIMSNIWKGDSCGRGKYFVL